jgi:hypothetical protein
MTTSTLKKFLILYPRRRPGRLGQDRSGNQKTR